MRGVVLLTAIVPTIGHRYLVEFARDFMEQAGGYLKVIISTLSEEPTTFEEREVAFNDIFRATILHHHDDSAPQHPKTEEEWNYWKKVVEERAGPFDYFFASELYGAKMAELTGSQFIPVDVARLLYDVRGTKVRRNIFQSWGLIEPKFRRKLRSNWVLFGAESVGKTTTGYELSQAFGQYFPEWARPYLETVGPELTPQKMEAIVDGQWAMSRREPGAMVHIYDTDLLSTLGYYRILGWEPPLRLIQRILEWKPTPTRYLLLDTDTPFVKDQLRYGGEKRESTTQFWVDILEEFGREYTLIQGDSFEKRVSLCRDTILGSSAGQLSCTWKDLILYERKK